MTGKSMALLLAGDIGGTSARLGLFAPGGNRPRLIAAHTYTTHAFPGLAPIVDGFLGETGETVANIRGACFGVAGPVVSGVARLTNVSWTIDAADLARRIGLSRVRLANDLVAMAASIDVLTEDELVALQPGEPAPESNRALIAAGTGLGEALLHRVEGRFVPSPSEGGHADFAARNEDEIALARDLTARFGRAMVEHVVSGTGLVNLYRFAHERRPAPCAEGIDPNRADAPAAISKAGSTGRCDGCREAVRLFIDAYGAEAGNLALRSVATGGVFVGGGIAPKMIDALRSGAFLQAFRAKSPFESLMARIPVQIILEPEAGLIGAAVLAAGVLS
jgi:glucokinase